MLWTRSSIAGSRHARSRQPWNLAWQLQDGELAVRVLLRDRDSRFSAAFDEVFRSEGVEVIRLPCRTPVANSYLFSEREEAELIWTSRIIWASAIADDALWEQRHASFSTEELVELGFFVG